MKQRQKEGQKHYLSGKDDKHGHSVEFLVHKDIMNTIMRCRPLSSRLITIRHRAVPFNITVVQAYAQKSDYNDNEIKDFYEQLQNVIDQTPKRNTLVQGDWSEKVGKDASENWQSMCGPFCNNDTNDWSLPPLTILCWQTLSVITMHPEDGPGIA